MKSKIVIILLNSSILFGLFSNIASNKCNQVKWKKFIALGDSNTEMGFGETQWLNKIANMFERKLDVINRGFSGYNSKHIRYFLKDIFDEFDIGSITGVTILLGTNDSTNKTNTLLHVPLDKYKENMKAIINYLISIGVKANKIILISPPRIDEEAVYQIIGENNTYYDSLVKDYAQVCRDIEGDLGVLFVDINKAMNDDKYKEYFYDGVHFSKSGSEFLFENLKPVLKENIEVGLEVNFPLFTDLDTLNSATRNNLNILSTLIYTIFVTRLFFIEELI
jgi:lysophospholipase L1-like esterase